MICPYCNSEAKLEDTIKIYKSRSYGMAYICSNYPECDSYVGVHKGTDKPLGRMANKELRKAKSIAHFIFDKLWKSGLVRRNEAYEWLAKKLNIKREDCHIGMFDVEMCKKAALVCRLKIDTLILYKEIIHDLIHL